MPGQELVIDDQVPVEKPEPVKKEEKQYAPIDKLEEIRKEQEAKLSKLEKQFNGISYGLRKIEDLTRMVETLKQTPQTQHSQQHQVPANEWDEKVTKDWKGTVEQLADMRAEQKYKELREREKQEEIRQRMLQQQTSILESSKIEVLKRYPDIEDPTSESNQRFMKVLRANPAYLQNEYGPILAMRHMEDEMRNEGKLDPQAKQVVDKEISRQARVNATSAPTKGKATSESSTSLTQDEMKMCKENGINLETYKKMKQSMAQEKQVEV